MFSRYIAALEWHKLKFITSNDEIKFNDTIVKWELVSPISFF